MNAMKPTLAVVLAAGKGTRMESDLPKVLVPVGGRAMIRYVVDALRAAGIGQIVVVVGYKAELVRQELADEPGVEFAEQNEQLGTGHAVMMCREQISSHASNHPEGPVLIVTGDSPMLQVQSVEALLGDFYQAEASCLLGTAHHDNPHGLGRIVRNASGDFVAIVEEKDATLEQKSIDEVNMSTYLFAPSDLLGTLDQLSSDNAQGEYYITDAPGILREAGKLVRALDVLQPCEALSINNLADLAIVEREMQRQQQTT